MLLINAANCLVYTKIQLLYIHSKSSDFKSRKSLLLYWKSPSTYIAPILPIAPTYIAPTYIAPTYVAPTYIASTLPRLSTFALSSTR